MATLPKGAGAGGRHGLTLQQAMEEAHRCMLCHDAPCSRACPGGTDPSRFIRQIRFYNLKGAARTVLANNPLGGVCAWVCPTEDTCVKACLRTGLDRPVDIDGLQRFAAEYGRAQGVKALEAGKPRGKSVAIVGAGPAGLAAAARLAVLGYRVTLFEARQDLGGMLRYGVPASRLPDKTLEADLDAILALGVEVRKNTPVDREDGAETLLAAGYDAVFVAPGLWQPYALDLPGKDLLGVAKAIDFLADCREQPERARALVAGKNVAVVGGGSVAMDVASSSRDLGAGRIYAICLEGMTELPAAEAELDQARADGLIIKPQCRLTAILGDGTRVTGVEGEEVEWIEPGKLVPSNARAIEGTCFRLKVGAVIQAIGQGPTAVVGRIMARADKQGRFLKADPRSQATSLKRIFAGGDIVRGAGTVVAAVGDGKRAAEAIHQLLGEEEVAR
jgi:NADPH-dependent glutamate synthase beta subunit-like oxidoreductase